MGKEHVEVWHCYIHHSCTNPPCVLRPITITPLIYFPHCCLFLLHRCPLVAVTATAVPAADAAGNDAVFACDSGVLGSVCLNVNSVSRTDICDNQDPAKLYCLHPEASAS